MSATHNAVNRSELIDQLTKKYRCPPEDTEMVVKVILSEISQALAEQRRVEIRGFGHFEARFHPAQTRLNPKTGQPVQVEDRYSVHFTAGKQLKESVDQDA